MSEPSEQPATFSKTFWTANAVELLEPARVAQARDAVERHYGMQRERYGAAFRDMGLDVHTGDGGFYHWMNLPDGLDASELNRRLFIKHRQTSRLFDDVLGSRQQRS